MDNNLTYKGYLGTVSFSSEDEVFYGKTHENDIDDNFVSQ